MVGKRIGPGEIGEAASTAGFFRQAHRSDLGLGKDDFRHQPIVETSGRIARMARIPPGKLTLLDGNVHNIVEIRDIPDGKDMGLRCPHSVIHNHTTGIHRHLSRRKIQTGDVRNPAKRVEHQIAGQDLFLPFMQDGHRHLVPVSLYAELPVGHDTKAFGECLSGATDIGIRWDST
jgi:hypothetical protein